MASTRSSSPASRGSSPEPLTPRSKIKALLATLDSSDDEDTARPAKSALAAGLGIHQSRSGPSSQPASRHGEESSNDDGSDVEVRPRGRLASRMQGGGSATGQVKPASDGAASKIGDTVVDGLSMAEEQLEDGDQADVEPDEDELPVAPRRLKRRSPRPSTPPTEEQAERAASPGLFVSPAKSSPSKSTANATDSDSELPAPKSDRFKELVERKRQERLAREAAEDTLRAERHARQEKHLSTLEQLDSDDEVDGDVSDIADDEGGRRLTQEARPTRKASKRAIEEMSRETQRMQRNMQLVHEAKTRNRVTMGSFLEHFNYRPAGESLPVEHKVASSSRPSTPQSELGAKEAETPPTSPPSTKKAAGRGAEEATVTTEDTQLDDMPSLEDVLASVARIPDKAKAKAAAADLKELDRLVTKLKRQVRVKMPITRANYVSVDSDDELQITTTSKDKLNAVFDAVPAKKEKESHSLQALRALAQVKSPGKDNRKRDDQGMTRGQLHAQLHLRARQQAKLERGRRMELLKAQGVVVQTPEERERQMQEVEDIVAKARDEAQKIMQQERAESKAEQKENGTADPLAWDDSEDEDYQDKADETDVEEPAPELSGSEDEGEPAAAEDGEEEDAEETGMALFDDQASDAETEASEDQPAAAQVQSDSDDALEQPAVRQRRARKNVAVLSDDEDELRIDATPKPKATVQLTPRAPSTVSPALPGSVLRSARKTFIPGLPVDGPAGLGLTQIFAGTMDDDSQMDDTQLVSGSGGPTQSMMPDFDSFPDSNFSATMEEPVEDMIVDSQREETQKHTYTQGVQLDLSQSQMHGLGSLMRDETQSQMSEVIEPTQDGGIQQYTPLTERFVEPPVSTVETVAVDQPDETLHDSPLVRRGRLRRRNETALAEEETPAPDSLATPTAFTVMRENAKQEQRKQLVDEFDRKKSKAKEMVHEQAEESEDEYAGIGGVDGEDSDNESATSVNEMIDDAAGNDVDKSKLAAFYADRERVTAENEVQKLFKDLTNGNLRRKRGANYDLSDSDDDGESRRRVKQRKFAKMQKNLYADERVKKMAENPGNQAFLRSIEDRGSEDELDILAVDEPQQQQQSSTQSESQLQLGSASQAVIADSQPRRPLSEAPQSRAPAHMRRTKGAKPSNIGEIRETLSNLLDEPRGSIIPATDAGSDSEEEDAHTSSSLARSDKENEAPHPRRGRVAVVDRLLLKRNASSSTATTSNSGSRLAFATATSSESTFKVPMLLRRATANSFASTASSASAGGAGVGDGRIVKKTGSGGRRSGVNALVRGNDGRARVEDGERRRREKRAKGAEGRVGMVGGLLGRGSFE